MFDPGPLCDLMRARPDEWPEARDPAWPGVRMALPEGLANPVACMLEAGYGDDAVRRILGGNWRRVCQAAWG